MSNIEMNIALGEGIRRLPTYLLLDCSGSMSGAPIEAVKRGVEVFTREVLSDTFARETVYLGVITFGDKVEFTTKGLVYIENFQPPTLHASGLTPLGEALKILQTSLDNDIKPAVKGGEKGDWKPLVFILTDGEPTDDWQKPRQEILTRQQKKVLNVITVGCGPGINEQNLKAIAIGPTFRMDNSEASFKIFFQWASQSVRAVSKAVSQAGGGEKPLGLQAPPPQIQFIP